ncbi:MAG: hypothetical protein AB7O26_15075 [Planctomycetaceae bacterium]
MTFLENAHGGIVFMDPWPFAMPFVCEEWPVALTRHGLHFRRPNQRLSDVSGSETESPLAYDAIHSIEQRDANVVVNQCRSIRCASTESARELSLWLRILTVGAESAHDEAIDNRLFKMTDTGAIRVRLAALRRETHSVRIVSAVFFGLVFGIGTLCLYLPHRVTGLIWVCAAGLLALWLFVIRSFSIAHKRLYPEGGREHRRQMAMMLLSPVAAMRAPALLSRNLLSGFHPLAAASVLCPEIAFRDLARRALLKLRYDVAAQAGNNRCGQDDTAASFDGRLLRHLERVVIQAGIDVSELLEAPSPDLGAKSYCPRCHAQFIFAEGPCLECGGIAAREFVRTPRGGRPQSSKV